MDFKKICKERYSTRDFSDRKADEKTVGQILELIRLVPTALNRQPYKILVAESDEAIKKLKKAKAVLYNAKTVLIICSDRANAWANRYSGETDVLIDVGIVVATALYAAKEFGLNSCCICNFDPELVKKEFDLPQNLTADALIALGYKSECDKPSERHFARKNIEQLTATQESNSES